MNEPKEPEEPGQEFELLGEQIEYQKKINFDSIIFRHIDRCNRVLSLGDPLAYGNCVAGFYAMLSWSFEKDSLTVKDLAALDVKLQEKIEELVKDKQTLNDSDKVQYNEMQSNYVIDKFGILMAHLGRMGKLWMNMSRGQ